MSVPLLLVVYCAAIAAASFLGGYIPHRLKLTHTAMQTLMSAVAGFMFGVAVLHMLGHALPSSADCSVAPEGLNTTTVLYWLIAGFVVMFFTQRFFAFHTHDPSLVADAHGHADCDHDQPVPSDQDHVHAHAAPKISWVGATIGMTIHSLIGGVALAAAVIAVQADIDSHLGHNHALPEPSALGWAGFSVFLAVLLHKPLDALTIVALGKAGGLTPPQTNLLNLGFACVVPVGVLLAYFGLSAFFGDHPQYMAYALAFSAGTFICIALSDLLPEVQFHQHDRVKLSAALLVGLALAWGVGLLEHALGHDHHGHGHAHEAQVETDDHAGHDHGPHDGHDH
ncbi:MAG: ZIP family metal transporter [Planctomycetota bacterium]